MTFKQVRRILATVLPSAFLIGGFLVAGTGVASARVATIFVSPSGTPLHGGFSCATARYSTIQSAVNAAPRGATVVACKGTYAEDVVVSRPLTLLGQAAVIQAVGTTNSTCLFALGGPPVSAPCLAGVTIKSSHVEINGFTVKGAIGEGILATGSPVGSISDVTITGNRVNGNDTGGSDPHTVYPQCQASGGVPGDCGEGVHLMGVARSTVAGNTITANSGGILLTDEFGPTHANLISNNVVSDNVFDCGITLPGHNPGAFVNGHLKPSVAGVFNNVIRQNIVDGNGTKGFGAGIGLFGPAPGTAVYNNTVEQNVVEGNGLGGVTLHAHLPGGQYMSGNRVVGNFFGTNNVAGDQVDTDVPGSNPPGSLSATTGVLLYSAATPLTITVAGNLIVKNIDGIWSTNLVTVRGVATNAFIAVAHPFVSVAPGAPLPPPMS
jgi:parallel beta-helix repeat protein